MSEIYDNRTFIEALIRGMFLSPAVHRKALALGVTPEDFLPPGDYQLPVYLVLVKTGFDLNSTPLSKDVVGMMIDQQAGQGLINQVIQEQAKEALDRIFGGESVALMENFFLEELPKFIKHRRSKKILFESGNDIDRIQREYKKAICPLDLASSGEIPIQDRFVNPFEKILKKSVMTMITTGYAALDVALGGGMGFREFGIIVGHSGGGKCHGKGTKILMSTGEIKNVEDIQVGDLLMGNDSTPRKVLSLARGTEQMYKVEPIKGESWTCNESHVLSLQVSYNYLPFKKGEVVNMSVRDYLCLPIKQRACLKLYRTGVEFQPQPLDFDPYLIGLWLGGGSRHKCAITNTDEEVLEYLSAWAIKRGYNFRKEDITYHLTTKRGQPNPLWTEVKACLTSEKDKFIPTKYLRNSRKNRLALLAGLIDSDGHYHNGFYEITSKFDSLAEGILYLARSLGFAAYNRKKIATLKSRNYSCVVNRINISGDLTSIPCKIARKAPKPRNQCKSVLRTGFSLKKLQVDEYYGFELSGNHLYLLGDFTVTHNTAMGTSIAQGAAMAGYKTLYVSMEEEKEDIANRMYSSVFEVDYTSLHNGRGYMELEQKVSDGVEATRMKTLSANLRILDLKGVTPITASRLKEIVDEFAKKNDYYFQLLIVDQLQFMEPENETEGEGEWLKEKQIVKELDEISHMPIADDPSKNFGMWVLHQAKGKVKIYYTTDEIAGFKGIVHKPETVLGIGRENPSSTKFELFSLKNRHAKGFRLPLEGDLTYMRFKEAPGAMSDVQGTPITKSVVHSAMSAGNFGDPSMQHILNAPPTPPRPPAPPKPPG